MDDNGSDRGVIIDTGVLRINELRQPDEVDPDQQKRLHSYVKSDHAGHHYVQPQTGDQVVFRLREAKATGVQQQDAAATSASGTAAGGSAAPHASAPQVAVLGSPKVPVGVASALSYLHLGQVGRVKVPSHLVNQTVTGAGTMQPAAAPHDEQRQPQPGQGSSAPAGQHPQAQRQTQGGGGGDGGGAGTAAPSPAPDIPTDPAQLQRLLLKGTTPVQQHVASTEHTSGHHHLHGLHGQSGGASASGPVSAPGGQRRASESGAAPHAARSGRRHSEPVINRPPGWHERHAQRQQQGSPPRAPSAVHSDQPRPLAGPPASSPPADVRAVAAAAGGTAVAGGGGGGGAPPARSPPRWRGVAATTEGGTAGQRSSSRSPLRASLSTIPAAPAVHGRAAAGAAGAAGAAASAGAVPAAPGGGGSSTTSGMPSMVSTRVRDRTQSFERISDIATSSLHGRGSMSPTSSAPGGGASGRAGSPQTVTQGQASPRRLYASMDASPLSSSAMRSPGAPSRAVAGAGRAVPPPMVGGGSDPATPQPSPAQPSWIDAQQQAAAAVRATPSPAAAGTAAAPPSGAGVGGASDHAFFTPPTGASRASSSAAGSVYLTPQSTGSDAGSRLQQAAGAGGSGVTAAAGAQPAPGTASIMTAAGAAQRGAAASGAAQLQWRPERQLDSAAVLHAAAEKLRREERQQQYERQHQQGWSGEHAEPAAAVLAQSAAPQAAGGVARAGSASSSSSSAWTDSGVEGPAAQHAPGAMAARPTGSAPAAGVTGGGGSGGGGGGGSNLLELMAQHHAASAGLSPQYQTHFGLGSTGSSSNSGAFTSGSPPDAALLPQPELSPSPHTRDAHSLAAVAAGAVASGREGGGVQSAAGGRRAPPGTAPGVVGPPVTASFATWLGTDAAGQDVDLMAAAAAMAAEAAGRGRVATSDGTTPTSAGQPAAHRVANLASPAAAAVLPAGGAAGGARTAAAAAGPVSTTSSLTFAPLQLSTMQLQHAAPAVGAAAPTAAVPPASAAPTRDEVPDGGGAAGAPAAVDSGPAVEYEVEVLAVVPGHGPLSGQPLLSAAAEEEQLTLGDVRAAAAASAADNPHLGPPKPRTGFSGWVRRHLSLNVSAPWWAGKAGASALGLGGCFGKRRKEDADGRGARGSGQ